MKETKLNEKLQMYSETLQDEFHLIPVSRQQELAELGDYIFDKRQAGQDVHLTVICTHNSRRSHMGQLWLAAAAEYYDMEGFFTYSGGTETTAFNTRAVAALRRAGFEIVEGNGSPNIRYEVSIGDRGAGLQMFSKKYDDPVNPQKDFAAVMVCSEADAACPIVPGAEMRIALPYEDPKNSDGTPAEARVYDERCRQIAREMFFAVRHAAERFAGK